ncbi:MAG: transporter [Chloroflexi bacterium]|nr:transporter [Chloroflexota bacterium]
MLRALQLNRTPLRDYRFRRLWMGLIISRFGDAFTMIALLWLVLDITGSGTALGIVLLCFSTPAILTSPFLGRLLDIFQPRHVMAIDNILRSIIIGAIPILYWLDKLELWVIYLLAVLAGMLTPATNVGVRVLMPEMVSNDELESANGLLSAGEQFSFMAGPATAGFLISLLGGASVLLIDAVSFLVMGLLLFSLPDIIRSKTGESTRQSKGFNWSGFGVFFKLKEVRIITTLSFVFFLAYMPLEPALPLFTRQQLGTDAGGFGLLWSSFGAGAVVGLIFIPFLARYARPGVVFSTVALAWGLFLMPLVWLTSLPLAMFFFFLAGCAWAPYMTIETTMLQRLTPAPLRGQVFGIRSTLLSTCSPLGIFLGSVLLQFLTANLVIGISALACILAGVTGLLSPRLRQITRPAKEASTGQYSECTQN